MKNRIVRLTLAVGVLLGMIGFVHARQTKQQVAGKAAPTDRVDLKTETLVGKTLDEVVDGPNGKEYRYTYRVQAKPTEKEMPRYTVSPQYEISYTKEGFQEKDSITLLSENTESGTDSPIWVYQVTYVGSGERKISFDTAGSAMVPMFTTVNSETDEGEEGDDDPDPPVITDPPVIPDPPVPPDLPAGTGLPPPCCPPCPL